MRCPYRSSGAQLGSGREQVPKPAWGHICQVQQTRGDSAAETWSVAGTATSWEMPDSQIQSSASKVVSLTAVQEEEQLAQSRHPSRLTPTLGRGISNEGAHAGTKGGEEHLGGKRLGVTCGGNNRAGSGGLGTPMEGEAWLWESSHRGLWFCLTQNPLGTDLVLP